MSLVYSLIIVVLIALLLTQNIKQKKYIYYCIASLIAFSTTFYEILKLIYGVKISGIIYDLEKVSIKGIISISVFFLVMFAGALNTKWNVTRKLLSIRSELSIIAAILMLPHGIIYIIRFILSLLSPNKLTSIYVFYVVVGIIAFIIMIPLFITSFNKIRRKINAKRWKKIQKWAYVFYLLAYVHILVILLNGKQLDWLKLIVYNVIFIMYLILKSLKTFKKKV